MKRLSLLLSIVVLLSWAAADVARAGSSADYSIESNLLASGGGTSSSADYTVAATIGQLAIGEGSSASYTLCSGVCQVEAALSQLFLPLVRR